MTNREPQITEQNTPAIAIIAESCLTCSRLKTELAHAAMLGQPKSTKSEIVVCPGKSTTKMDRLLGKTCKAATIPDKPALYRDEFRGALEAEAKTYKASDIFLRGDDAKPASFTYEQPE